MYVNKSKFNGMYVGLAIEDTPDGLYIPLES